MAIYNSPQVSSNQPMQGIAGVAGVRTFRATVACSASPSTTDTLNFFDVPAGARVVGGYLSSTDMDTNGTPTIALNIGDAGSANRHFAASNVAQAGTAAQDSSVTSLDYQYLTKTRITGTASTNAATGAAGTVTLCLLIQIEGMAS